MILFAFMNSFLLAVCMIVETQLVDLLNHMATGNIMIFTLNTGLLEGGSLIFGILAIGTGK